MASELLQHGFNVQAVSPEEEARREEDRQAAAECVARVARDDDDRKLLLAVLGLDPDFEDSRDAGYVETLDAYTARTSQEASDGR